MTSPAGELHPSSKYRFIAEIGRGGMGDVWLAVAQGAAGFKKLIVLKRALEDMATEPEVLAMFLDEARLAARLNHPNVVQTYEAGEDAGRHYIAMEYLEGQSLYRIHTRVGRKAFPLPMQVRILIEALAGLHYAHELTDFDGTPLGMVHRDATPQNIFVTYDGQIKVVDFGMAKAASSLTKTRLGILKGKVTYMAPEQARLEPLDRRTDIFAIGIILWEAIVGERMWHGCSDGQIIRRLAAGDLPSLQAKAPSADPELQRICLRALDSAPAKRYATATELQQDLERWLGQRGENVTARMVGSFVSTSFETDRAAIKTLLEQELKGYSRANAGDPNQPMIETRLSILAGLPEEPSHSTSAATAPSDPSIRTSRTTAPSNPAIKEPETRGQSSVSVDIPVEKSGSPSSTSTLSAARSHRRSQRSRWIGGTVALVAVGAAATALMTFGAPLAWFAHAVSTGPQASSNPGPPARPLDPRGRAHPSGSHRQRQLACSSGSCPLFGDPGGAAELRLSHHRCPAHHRSDLPRRRDGLLHRLVQGQALEGWQRSPDPRRGPGVRLRGAARRRERLGDRQPDAGSAVQAQPLRGPKAAEPADRECSRYRPPRSGTSMLAWRR